MKTGSTLSNLKPVTVKTNGNPAVCVPELYTFAGRVKSNLHKLKLLTYYRFLFKAFTSMEEFLKKSSHKAHN